jgi:CheY-like chemotaxis protein
LFVEQTTTCYFYPIEFVEKGTTKLMAYLDSPRILIVDDSQIDSYITTEMLRGNYHTITAISGADAVQACQSEHTPKLILMDVSMPDMDGYETCELLKSNPLTSNIPIIFITASSSNEEKLKAFEHGAIDFLTKPVHSLELIKKIDLAIGADYKVETAIDAAMAAITDAEEQATIIHFLQKSFACKSFEALAELVVETTSLFELSSTVQIRTPNQKFEYSSSGQVAPIELQVFEVTDNLVRIHQQGPRLILSFGSISQLIRNLPKDELKVTRLREQLSIILEGAVSRIQNILLSQDLELLMLETNESLKKVKELQINQTRQGLQLVDDLRDDIRAEFLNSGLTEKQELMISSKIEKFAERNLVIFEEGLKVDNELKHIAKNIGQSYRRVGVYISFSE